MLVKRTSSNHFGLTGKWLFFWLMITNSTSMLLFGYDQGVFGGILTIKGFETRFGIQDNETLKGVIVGSYDLGCLFGALITGPLGGRIGRKRSIILGTTIMMIGALMQFLAPDFAYMTAGRVIAGIGNGMNTATAPVWAAETSKTSKRGRTGMTLMVINIGGLATSCWMTYCFSFVKSELAWRFPLGFQLFFVLVIYLTAFWLPESPRWLIMKRQNQKALDIMVALEGPRAELGAVQQNFEEIRDSIILEQNPDMKRNAKPVFRLILGVGAQAMQQLTGINVICYYLPYVLTESVGLDGEMARLLAAVNAMTYLGSTFIGLYFIERWGRRTLLIGGAGGQCCCWLAITILLKFASSEMTLDIMKQRQLGSAAVLFFFLFNCFFGAGWLGVSWLYPTEINSTQHRIAGMSYGVATNWLINFAVVFITPLCIAKLGSQFYVIWTVLNGLMVPIIWLFYPETAGRSLEDIDRMFEAHPTVWVFTHASMISRRPPVNLASGSREASTGFEMNHDIPRSYNRENVPVMERTANESPYSIDISHGQGPRRPSQQPLDHPGALIENSLTIEDVAEADTDLTQTATLVSSQTGPSLGPQISTAPLL